MADLGIQHDSAQMTLTTCPVVVQAWSGSHIIGSISIILLPNTLTKSEMRAVGKRSRDPSNAGGLYQDDPYYRFFYFSFLDVSRRSATSKNPTGVLHEVALPTSHFHGSVLGNS